MEVNNYFIKILALIARKKGCSMTFFTCSQFFYFLITFVILIAFGYVFINIYNQPKPFCETNNNYIKDFV